MTQLTDDQRSTPPPSEPPQSAPRSSHIATYLGPAKVIGKQGQVILVELENADRDQVVAQTAFTFPYEPAADDRLLVMGQGTQHFAVGVLSGSKPGVLAFAGEAHIRAINGKLTLASDQAIALRAPRITVRTGILRTIATSVVEKADHVRRWVRGLMAIRAGNSRRVVDGEDSTRCQNSTTLAKDTVKIDGDQLHLGH